MYYEYKKEIKSKYELMNDIKCLVKGYLPDDDKANHLENYLCDLKREIRKIYKRIDKALDEPQVHYDREYGESCWWKEWYNTPFTEEEKLEWIEDNWIHIYSPYDCTGRWFTKSIEIYNVETSFGAKSVVYYFMGLDV